MSTPFTAHAWFSKGERVLYAPINKEILGTKASASTIKKHFVFHRISNDALTNERATWITFLPGYPDGSFGWARIDKLLENKTPNPRLFIEYLGQGDSDKPVNYNYSTKERANLVEAFWKYHQISSSFVVTFDYSSLVLLELLSRQLELKGTQGKPYPQIKKVLIINGGLFADGHSHPWYTTPLLKTSIGKMGTWFAQKSKWIFNQMMKGLWSKAYGVSKAELDELFLAITRRNGMAFVSKAAGFVDEHQMNASRWDFERLYLALKDSISFHLVGSKEDPFESNQINLAKERLGHQGLDIRLIPGGHLSTSEQPELLVEIIRQIEQEQPIQQRI